MNAEQRAKYIHELRFYAQWIHKEWSVSRVPWHLRVAVMSYARHFVMSPAVWEDE